MGWNSYRKPKGLVFLKLLMICEINACDATTSIIASKIAPRLNSLGRIAEPEDGVRLLLIRNNVAAEKLANELNLYNIEITKNRKAHDKGRRKSPA